MAENKPKNYNENKYADEGYKAAKLIRSGSRELERQLNIKRARSSK